jgi:hypothetical protein
MRDFDGSNGRISMRAPILIPALLIAAGLSTAAVGQGAPRVEKSEVSKGHCLSCYLS